MSKSVKLGAVASVLVLALSGTAFAAAGKEAPGCSAISFRPVVGGAPDGEQDAGLYKSRFAKIELKANVKSGEPQNYYMLLNGKKAEPIAGGVPKSAETCLKSKNVQVPVKSAAGNCNGNRFRVVIDDSSGQKIAMLFGLQNNIWNFCNAAKL